MTDTDTPAGAVAAASEPADVPSYSPDPATVANRTPVDSLAELKAIAAEHDAEVTIRQHGPVYADLVIHEATWHDPDAEEWRVAYIEMPEPREHVTAVGPPEGWAPGDELDPAELDAHVAAHQARTRPTVSEPHDEVAQETPAPRKRATSSRRRSSHAPA